ncbi:DUF5412 domain-containing protein [Kurthia sp. Dielmo]|uniref:DUF5412 domain-containing protein n=1 Tax=Kurthia sp. Dielmo TaxID=1033738 RepID=UPI00111FE660|nr:DUF5412 domain-containing protein [Kurthia sp. Dielmo]
MTDRIAKKSRKRKKIIKISALIGVLLIGMIGYGMYWAFFDMNRLPVGEYVTEKTSPDGTYTIKAYRTNAGATTSYSIRGELTFNNSTQKTKNIYWNNREDTAKINWLSNDKVVINGHTLEVPNEKYDFRQ